MDKAHHIFAIDNVVATPVTPVEGWEVDLAVEDILQVLLPGPTVTQETVFTSKDDEADPPALEESEAVEEVAGASPISQPNLTHVEEPIDRKSVV